MSDRTTVRLAAAAAIALALGTICGAPAGAQEQTSSSAAAAQEAATNFDERIEALEKRVAEIERQVWPSAHLWFSEGIRAPKWFAPFLSAIQNVEERLANIEDATDPRIPDASRPDAAQPRLYTMSPPTARAFADFLGGHFAGSPRISLVDDGLLITTSEVGHKAISAIVPLLQSRRDE